MFSVAFSLLFATTMLRPAIGAQNGQNVMTFVGSKIEFACDSSFPPPWNKIGPKPGDFESLGFNGQKHPNFKDERFIFVRENSVYKLGIDDLRISDAGNYRCDGAEPVSYSLSVVR